MISERSAAAVFDGERGIPLLVLQRAAELASEKARECGAGLVRVVNAPATGSAAGVAAEVALGPAAALILGPGASWTVALPSAEGLPVVFEPALASELGGKAGRSSAAKVGAARQALAPLLAPWTAVLAPGEGWLVAALSITAMESLSTFHERVADTLHGLDEADGLLLPAPWEARRCEARRVACPSAPQAGRRSRPGPIGSPSRSPSRSRIDGNPLRSFDRTQYHGSAREAPREG